ncbi:uncharacterized protein LOC134815880 [Bolinopsis microptera]|uniref:uncharacterized protein LOC134815880 n=1 Tax=Bolinopsis microptera TaxID=2820187 RepID=UPI00307A7C12
MSPSAKYYFQLILCFLGGHATSVVSFSYGILQVYLYSYLYQYNPALTMKQMHLQLPVLYLACTSCGWLQGYLSRWISTRILHLVNMLSMCGWCVVLFWICQNFVAATIALAGIGLSNGMLHVYFVSTSVNKAKRHPSLVSGIYGIFQGTSGIWGNIIGSTFMNPWSLEKQNIESSSRDYIFTDERVLSRVPYMWLILAAILFILLLPGLIFIDNDVTEDYLAVELQVQENSPLRETNKENLSTENCLNEKDRVSKPILGTLMFLTAITIGINHLCVFDLFKDFALKLKQYDNSDMFLNNFGVALVIAGAAGRLVWGFAGDHVPTWLLLVVGNGASAVLQILMYYGRRDKIWYLIVCTLLATTTGMMSIMPSIIKRHIGQENLARNFGLLLVGETLGTVWYLVFVTLVGNIPDLTMVWALSVPALLSLVGDIIMIGKY